MLDKKQSGVATMISLDLNEIDGLVRVEGTPKADMQELCMEMTHSVYPHKKVYGDFCPIQSYVNCPPLSAFRYLAETKALSEWTYSLRDMVYLPEKDLFEFTDAIGGTTKCYTKTVENSGAMTVDYHCAWDQPDHLWMIYLMRVVPAELVLNKPGCVITWINCRHPFYDENPFPELAPDGRKVWVGDGWPFFYAGHAVELENLKRILEYRHAHNAWEL